MKNRSLILIVVCALALAFPAAAGADCGKHHGSGDHAEHAGHAGHGKECPMKDKKITETSEVSLSGSLLCKHCDLHQAESCQKVFQASDEAKTVYELCPGSEIDLEELEGAEIVVSGKLMKAGDGATMLMIEKAEKKIAPGA